MSLSSTCINRPVLATVMNIIVMLVGCIGVVFLGVRDYPSVDPPIISVSASFPGANADVIETQVTEPLEAAINGIQGIRSLTSTSRDRSEEHTSEHQPRRLQPHHRRVQPRRRSGNRRQRRPRQSLRRPLAPSARHRHPHRQQSRRRRPTHLRSLPPQRRTLPHRPQHLRRPILQRAPPDHLRRQQRLHLGRETLLRATPHGPLPARGLRRHPHGRP